MTGTFAKRAGLAATAMGVVLSAPAYAQASEEASYRNDAIVVTARRIEENLQDVPISITVFDQEEVSKQNITNSTDLATYTPSLSTNERYGPEKASFAIRGFVQEQDTAPSVGVYFADVVAPRAGGATTSGDGAGVGQLFDLQNVQVLKGPQGTLFGRNTTGGAILFVPQKPTDRLEGHIEGSLGNYDMRRFQGVLNIPLADTFKVRLGVDRQKRDGFLKNHSGIGPKAFNNTDYLAARLSILAELTPDLENYTIATYSDSDTYGTVPRVMSCFNTASGVAPFGLQGLGASFGCGQIARQAARGDGFWDVENNNPDPTNHIRQWQLINTTTWQVTDDIELKNIVSYAEFREDARQNIAGEFWLLPNGAQYTQNIILRNQPGGDNSSQSTMTEELRLSGNAAGGRLAWQAGGYMERSNPIGYGRQFAPFLLNCPDAGNLQCSTPVGFGYMSATWSQRWFRSYGLYAQGTYDLTDQLSMTAGLRYTWDKSRHYYASTQVLFPQPNTPAWSCSNRIYNSNPDGSLKVIQPYDFHACDLEFSTSSKEPTWTIGFEYKPTSDAMLFAKWTRGYRTGGVLGLAILYESWEPEKVDTYEIGAKTMFDFGAARGNFNVTGFYNDFTNQQINASLQRKADAPVLGGSATINAGKSRIWGVEVDTAVTLFDQLKLQAGYAYLNTKLKELSNVPADDFTPYAAGGNPWARVVPSAIVGGPLGLTPKHNLTLSGTYTLPLDESIGEISFGATWVYSSSTYSSRATTDAYEAGLLTFAPGFADRDPGVVPSHDLLNLNASWNSILDSTFDLSFFMTNVTNEKYPLANARYFGSFGFESQLVNAPRMWGFRLKYRFGE